MTKSPLQELKMNETPVKTLVWRTIGSEARDKLMTKNIEDYWCVREQLWAQYWGMG